MRKRLKCLVIVLLLIISASIVGYFTHGGENADSLVSSDEPQLTMEEIGKEVTQYSWADFESLSGEEQLKFQKSFKTQEDFEAWMNDAKTEKYNLPWENGGKQPNEYTWEEFEALSGAQQIQFQNSFDSIDDFDDWLNRVKTE